MLQDIVVYILIILALSITIIQTVKIIRKKNKVDCIGCPNCGIKTEIHNKKLLLPKKV